MGKKDLDFSAYRYVPGTSLSAYATRYAGELDKGDLKSIRNHYYDELEDLQEALYAESSQSLLIVLQAMDAAGKDSTIEKLSRCLNAQGCKVHSFKKPTDLEMAHDFLWRVHQRAPAKGEMCLFNRSHYEDVLIVKVHGWASEEQTQARYQHINNFEALLADRGTRVLKFMLNISPEYQKERFVSRIENLDKRWKFNPGDLVERSHWQDYMQAFEMAMTECTSNVSPWYVVPAENRDFRDVMIAGVVMQTLREMNPQYPAADFDPDKYPSESIV